MAEIQEQSREDLTRKLDTAARKEEQKLISELDTQREKMIREKKNKQAATSMNPG